LAIVKRSTKIKGAKNVKRKPTRRDSKNYESEIPKKKMLKKNLNWLNRTRGMNDNTEYF
jgi:hypothetical protein